jgi:hypothetical protein
MFDKYISSKISSYFALNLKMEKITQFVIAIFVCVAMANYIYTSFKIITWEYDLNPVENNIRFFLNSYKNFGSLYGPYENTKVVINTYAPPYYFLVTELSYLFPNITTFAGLRLLTILMEICLAYVIFLIVALESNKKTWGILSAIFF